jgi:hypothetical protein
MDNSSHPIIVSVSRRTDIPAFYTEWFHARLKAGFAYYQHPFMHRRIRIELDQNRVAGFVFWSKNFQPFLPRLQEILDRYRCYFHFTVTGYGEGIEPRVPPLEIALSTFKNLSRITSPQQLILRYDPILLSNELTPARHRERFSRIVGELESCSSRCIISFVQVYRKVRESLLQMGVDPEPAVERRLELAQTLQTIARDHGFSLEACCMPELQAMGIPMAHCVSRRYFQEMYSDFPNVARRGQTRPGCGCDSCQDLGIYDSCPHGCRYCYANARDSRAEQFLRLHDSSAESLDSGK